MKYLYPLLLLLTLHSYAHEITLDEKIAGITVLGFHGTTLEIEDKISQEVLQGLGGVILFDQDPLNKMKRKNIVNAKQLKKLNHQLQILGKGKLLICIDEEGGKVARLKAKDGFEVFSSAQELAQSGDINKSQQQYSAMAEMLKEGGINTNFAPDVDLLYGYNPIIAGKKRSYSNNPQEVVKYASVFVDEHRKQGVITVLKHFPGHGSSKGDSHKGFTDVTTTWSATELVPFMMMIETKKADMIMTAHIYNKTLDETYPATLSKKINTDILRKKLNYDGVIITDDLQMAAIHKDYSLRERVTLALNSGVDILLFANQLAEPLALQELIDVVKEQVKVGAIKEKRIDEAYARVQKLKEKL